MIDQTGRAGVKNEDRSLNYGITLKEFHILALICADYNTPAEIYQALKYLRLFLVYDSIMLYLKRLEQKELCRIIIGRGAVKNAWAIIPTMQGTSLLNTIEADLLKMHKREFRPQGRQAIPWNQGALSHLRFDANGNECDLRGGVVGVNNRMNKGKWRGKQVRNEQPEQFPSE